MGTASVAIRLASICKRNIRSDELIFVLAEHFEVWWTEVNFHLEGVIAT